MGRGASPTITGSALARPTGILRQDIYVLEGLLEAAQAPERKRVIQDELDAKRQRLAQS